MGKLKAALNRCVENDLLHDPPWAKYRQLPGIKHKPRSGTLDEFQRLYPAFPPWLQWASRTAIALCLRPGVSELFSPEWSAFGWRAKTVTVYMSKAGSTKLVCPPEAYLDEAWMRFREDTANGHVLVCRSRKDGATSRTPYRSEWRRACQKTGIAMPMHALRHIAASEMPAGGVDLAAVAAQLGHKNLTATGAFHTHAPA